MVGKCMYLTSVTAPLTTANLVQCFAAASPDVFLTVPYLLKLMAEAEAGVSALRQCKQVVSSGSMLSDELGNRLVDEGVNIETLFAGYACHGSRCSYTDVPTGLSQVWLEPR